MGAQDRAQNPVGASSSEMSKAEGASCVVPGTFMRTLLMFLHLVLRISLCGRCHHYYSNLTKKSQRPAKLPWQSHAPPTLLTTTAFSSPPPDTGRLDRQCSVLSAGHLHLRSRSSQATAWTLISRTLWARCCQRPDPRGSGTPGVAGPRVVELE